jgi:hypothetical protein
MRTPFQALILTQFAAGLRRLLTAACLWGIAGMFGATGAHAQEAVRYSLSRQLVTTPRPAFQPSFFTIGPFQTQLSASAGVSFDDNAEFTKTDTHSEVVFDQSLGLNLNWIISHLNELGLKFGGTLNEVVGGAPGQQKFYYSIDPETNINFKIFIGDFLIRIHNFLGVVQDTALNPAVSGLSNLNQLTNTTGIFVDWDLTRLVLSAGVDYSYGINLGGGDSGSTARRSTLRPSTSATFALTPTMNTGLEAAYSASFGAGSHSDVDAFSVGPFLRGKLTRFITLDLAAGYYSVHAPAADPNNYYLSLNISHQLNRFLQYGASFSRDLEFSGGNSLTENNSATLGIRYLLRRYLTLGTSGTINFGKVIISNANLGVLPGSYVQYQASVQLSLNLSRRFTTSLAYRFVDRNADQGSYKQNQVDFTLNYAF